MSMFIKPTPQGKVEALPAWAQRYIEDLSRLVDEQQAKLGEGPANSDTFLEPYDENRALGRRVTVRFVTAGAEPRVKGFDVDTRSRDPRGIEIATLHGERLFIHPVSSNRVILECGE